MKLEIASVSDDINRLKPQQEAQISGIYMYIYIYIDVCM
jgi:hypothetical protein